MKSNSTKEPCLCACHDKIHEYKDGLIHDQVCCRNLNGSLEWRYVKVLEETASKKALQTYRDSLRKKATSNLQPKEGGVFIVGDRRYVPLDALEEGDQE